VELDLSGRSERDALAYAANHNIAFVVFVGDGKGKQGALRVRRLDERTDRPLTFADLQAYARSESAAVAEGKTS
jgi:histidyl-tRNA synthetase